MITLFIYDISDDRTRYKVAQICQDYGLQRIQYSAFLGRLPDAVEEEFWQKCRRQLGEREGNLQMFYLTLQTLERSRKYLGKPPAPEKSGGELTAPKSKKERKPPD